MRSKVISIKEYAAELDSKHQITIRGSEYQYFQVKQYGDGRLELLPRVLVDPKEISRNPFHMIDRAVDNFKNGKVSESIDLNSINED